MFRNRISIALMVAVVLVTATTLVLGALGVINYRSAKNRELENVRIALTVDADQIAPSLDLPVWNFDRPVIARVVEGVMLDSILEAVVVKLVDNQALICARERDIQGKIRPLEKDFSAAGLLVEKRNITFANETLATVTLYGTTKSVDSKMRSILVWTVFNILSLDLILILGLYLLLWWLVLKPLKILEHHAAAVSIGGGDNLIIERTRFRGELENLRGSLAKMFQLLNARYIELQESESRFRSLAEAAFEGVCISENGVVLDMNNQGFKMFGYERGELIGKQITELIAPESRVAVSESICLGRETIYEHQLLRKDGSSFYAEARAKMVHVGGRTLRMTAIRDITERKRTEAERQQAVEREQQARIQYTFQLIAAQEAERKRIAAELHDSMGQNLLLIKNLAQMALQSQAPEQAYENIATISHLATQCVAEARQISRELHPYQLEHLGLKRALELLLENVTQAGMVKFDWKFDEPGKKFSNADATNLYRIVQESLNNILKHSRAQNVRLRLERDIHDLQLTIADDGCGFVPENQAPGMGLKNIAERVHMLGGTYKLDSAPGRGTRIEVIIPVADAID